MRNAAGCMLAPALLVLAACGGGQQSSAAEQTDDGVATVEIAPPQFTVPLVTPEGSDLDPKDVIEDGSRLLVLSQLPEALFALPMATPRALSRISQPRQFGQASVMAMVAHSAGISFLGVDGKLRVMKRDEPDRLARTALAYSPMERPLALGEGTDGTWIAAHYVLTRAGASSFVDSIVVSALDTANRVSRVHAFERYGPARRELFILDRVDGRALRDRVVLVGNEPARVIIVSQDGVHTDTLRDPPSRPLHAAVLARVRRALGDPRVPPFAREARLPTVQAVAVAAWPFDGGYLVVAEGGEDSFIADLYCGVTFRRSVLSRPSIGGMFVMENGLAVIDEPRSVRPESPARLSYYRARDLVAECAK